MKWPTLTLFQGDALTILKTRASDSVHCVVTSPPYWGLRDYGVTGQFGLEPTLDAYLDRLVAVFEEVKRVIHPSAVVFVDLGDSRRDKQLCLIPWRFALRMQERGWFVRDIIVFQKTAPMPESVTDRCTQAWEPILMLTKSADYFFDSEAIKEVAAVPDKQPYPIAYKVDGERNGDNANRWSGLNKFIGQPMRNARNVWSIGPEPFTDSVPGPDGKPVSHFAAYPSALVRRCVLAGSSAKGVCSRCGEPWTRQLERVKGENPAHRGSSFLDERDHATNHNLGKGERTPECRTIGWRVGCDCEAGDPVPATVLDPFAGTGTTCAVALELGRNAIGIELSPLYLELAKRRCGAITPGLQLA